MRLSETDASCETPITSFDASLPMNARTETAAPPLDQLTQAPASFMADGAYDRTATYDAILARNSFARFIVPPCKGAVPGPTATISPTQRDLHILAMDEQGRMNWQKASGYNKRSKVEAAIGRYKRVIGDALNSRHDARRATEVAIAVKSLNRMREFGQAKFVRVAGGISPQRADAPLQASMQQAHPAPTVSGTEQWAAQFFRVAKSSEICSSGTANDQSRMGNPWKRRSFRHSGPIISGSPTRQWRTTPCGLRRARFAAGRLS